MLFHKSISSAHSNTVNFFDSSNKTGKVKGNKINTNNNNNNWKFNTFEENDTVHGTKKDDDNYDDDDYDINNDMEYAMNESDP